MTLAAGITDLSNMYLCFNVEANLFAIYTGGANQVLTMIPTSEVGTARRAVRGRLGEATLPKADLRPSAGKLFTRLSSRYNRPYKSIPHPHSISAFFMAASK